MNASSLGRRAGELRAVELFSGAGGMTLGFERAGWSVDCAVESDPRHAAIHRLNFPDCRLVEADVRGLDREQLGVESPVDLVFGGPPCQGFSVGGARRPDDDRNSLVMEFSRIVGELQPTYFVLENVQGLAGRRRDVLDAFAADVRSTGYEIVEPMEVLDASDYGVPQRRRRLFVLGYRFGATAPAYPLPSPVPTPTVGDAIGDLPGAWSASNLDEDELVVALDPPSAYAETLRSSDQVTTLTGCMRTNHSEAVLSRFRETMPGEREPISRFVRLDPDGLSPTLRAGTNRQRGAFTAPRPIHPTEDRCITVREAARLSSFPDSFRFHPTRWYGFAQVGNSVPPLLAEAVAQAVLLAATADRPEKANGH